jgi:hypothetical protein
MIAKNVRNHSRELFPSKKIFNEFPTFFTKPGQYIVIVYNGFNSPSVTELGTEALRRYECDFCIMWLFNLDRKEYVMSMRSKEADVGSICKLFGGGGHTLAAACSFPSHKWKIEDMFFDVSLPRMNKI